ncbi:bifunctional diaminohydroxyphosphoribosylaminopyrimidine deaminase/5-amino-6-(5-phosphoribosylamino)uracil reductase RibD [Microbacterium oleivorans]|uniref:bifunctional diaminohydroxyphosphoribosylaminopyrimidine deaminase/5-amino-6-(5-phosphoribosylamino)uracil reductase RibD n=1 Tax=Microbacterium oleivorans TaxID=273677 RepID=UPI0010A4F688|nr:bifunctional diaminohydroxyphosphoribosylaminopyrimidine deaminase/5-amino-6-(5-phosphoribosylamino)uracil reductase RibD [Microbacterium oleivorans]THE07216.1 bifunctional diaminohydroxyphosphoribosylaminopyrimidine deaminase/5-amino-6-(5-phosphoribosylamino)uracil reductase RibD [Microbacterium oleivorans]
MSVTDAERTALRHAFALATRGPRGLNPQVGAVILSPTGEILAEGWHHGAGTPHAEIDALSKLDPDAARGATAVVTLEPCNHTGRTGPCAVALIEAGVARVVYSAEDPGAVSSGGAERLRAAGIDVDGGVLREEGEQLIESWLTVQRLGRPHVTVKWAQSLDGRAAASDGTSQWITGPDARADVHRRRSLADAIVVGTGTVLADDPALTARREDGDLFEDQPRPVVVGTRAVPQEARVRSHPRPFMQDEGDDLRDLLDRLRELGAHRVFLEGGPTLAASFLRQGLVDELLVYIAPTLIGGERVAVGDIGVATIAEQRRLDIVAVDRLGDDILVTLTPKES